jgi:hypothetical protein
MWRLKRVLATLIGIVLLSVFELFRLIGVTVAMMWLLASGLRSVTWAAEFLLRGGESREILGSWIRSGKVPEAKKRRVNQVITCSFPCGKWLHVIGARASPRCELCRRERETRGASVDSLPPETVAHISSSYWTVYKFFASQSQRKYKIIIFFSRRSKRQRKF